MILTNDNKIVLNAMKKAGVKIPKSDKEFKDLLADVRKDFEKMEKKK